MKRALRLIALAGSTVFGVILIAQVVVLAYIYIDSYRSPPPPFAIPSYHRFAVYRVNHDLRDLALILFAFICCLIGYVKTSAPEIETSK